MTDKRLHIGWPTGHNICSYNLQIHLKSCSAADQWWHLLCSTQPLQACINMALCAVQQLQTAFAVLLSFVLQDCLYIECQGHASWDSTSFRHNARQIILTKFRNLLDKELNCNEMLLPNIPSNSICQPSKDNDCPWMLVYTHNQQQFPCRHNKSLKWWTSILSRCGWQSEKTESPYHCYHLSSVQEAAYTMINITPLWQQLLPLTVRTTLLMSILICHIISWEHVRTILWSSSGQPIVEKCIQIKIV